MSAREPTIQQLKLLAIMHGAAWTGQILEAMDAEEELNETRPDLANADRQTAANLLLVRPDVLRDLDRKCRFGVLATCFDEFTLPEGWLQVALKGGITAAQAAAHVSDRLRRMAKGELARDEDFLDVLLTPTKNRRNLYGPHMDKRTLRQVAHDLRKLAPDKVASLRGDVNTLGWRHFL